MMNDYERQAKDFLKKHNAKITISFVAYKPYFTDDKESRNVYRVRIDRNRKTMYITFGDSLENTKKGKRPSVYSILACLEKYPVYSFEDFCSEYGYKMYADYPEEADKYGYNKESYRIFRACEKQYAQVERLFSDCLEELREIC